MRRYLMYITFFCLLTNLVNAQDYKFHSIFIYNFTKYIRWPEGAISGDFVIGVLGESKIKDALDVMAASKKVQGNRNIDIVEYSSISDIGKCHILFVPLSMSSKFDEIKSKISGKPILLITEKEGLGKKGSGINFILVDGKWKFELNKSAVESHDLRVANELTLLAILV